MLDFYGVTERGNFEGANVLTGRGREPRRSRPGLDAARARLLAAREERVRPGLDDKRLLAWNALAISALAEAGAVLGRDDYLEAARRCAEFVWEQMRDDAGHLLRTYKGGEARLNAYLEDHAFLLEALLTLNEARLRAALVRGRGRDGGGDARALRRPRAGRLLLHLGRPRGADRAAQGRRRPPDPERQQRRRLGLLRLAALSGERRYREAAEGIFALFAKPATEHPDAFAHLLRAIDFAAARVREVALVGDDAQRARRAWSAPEYRPHLVLAAGPEGAEQPPLLAGRTPSTAAPPPTSARTSPASSRSTTPTELRASS